MNPTTSSPDPTPPEEITAGDGNADVVFVRAEQDSHGSWTFAVTVRHLDTGWEDYADGWDVVLMDGTVIKPQPESPFTRLLLHPHVGEQPFTRSQGGIAIPPGERYVVVRAHDLMDGFGGETVLVDLFSTQGARFEVNRATSIPSGEVGITNHSLDGNRYLRGAIDLENAVAIDIPLRGEPTWVVGVPLADGPTVWLVALEDGSLQAFEVTAEGTYQEVQLPVASLPAGTPPAIAATETGIMVLNSLAPGSSVLTSPVITPLGQLAFVSGDGGLILEDGASTTELAINALPDGRILSDEDGNLLLLSEPSSAYSHAVLGDGLEAGAVNLILDPGGAAQVGTIEMPDGQVVEGIAPIWTDLNGDGVREILVTLSDAREGARLVVFSLDGEILASSQAVGTGYRWRHQIAAAPFGPNGEIEIVDVLTPHLGGVVEFFQIQGTDLVRVAQVPGYTSHVISSRNLDMALAADVNADGQVEVLLPSQGLNSLAAIRRTADGAEVAFEFGLDGHMSTNLGAVNREDGTLELAVGLRSGVLRVWMP